MNTTPKKSFSISYTLYDITNGKHEFIEKTLEDKNFEFISGMGVAIAAFEQKVINLNSGDDFSFTLTPAEAYGEIDDSKILDLDKNIFIREGKFDDEHIKEDAVIPLRDSEGKLLYGRVIDITEEKVKMDLNHPLAGCLLLFEGKIIDVHDATDKEIEKWISMLNGNEEDCGGCNSEEGHHCCCHHDGNNEEHHCCCHDEDKSEHCCHDENENEHQCCRHSKN